MQKEAAYYCWMILLCFWLVFGTGILCDMKIVGQELLVTIPSNSDNSCSKLNSFKCVSGQCIDAKLRCEGTRHCEDGSDEEGCPIKDTLALNYQSLHAIDKRAVGEKCIIPSIEGHLYSEDPIPNTVLSHGTEVDEFTVVYVNCAEEYYKNSSYDVIMSCVRRGKWKPVYSKLCLKMCPPKKSDSLDISCTYNGKYVDCNNQPSVPGTILTPKCKSAYYYFLNELGVQEPAVELQCDDNGTWVGGELYTCQPTCGQEITHNNKLLILYGKTPDYGTSPWNVGIYAQNKDTKRYDNIICGGTLISLNVVVSAAHCFWNDDDDVHERIITDIDERYKIAVGKYTSDIKIKDNEFTQFLDLLVIFLKRAYSGVSRSFDDDIAVIVLKTKITVNVVVSPACMNWKTTFNIPNGAYGKVVGWGLTENNILSPLLVEKELQLFELPDCMNMFGFDFQKYLTHDKICANDPTGRGGVDAGDSGAGFTYKHDNSHYLIGLVSSKERNNNNNTCALFTDIRYHMDWIFEIYNYFKSDSYNTKQFICSHYGDWSITYRKLCLNQTVSTITSHAIQSTMAIRKKTCIIPFINGNVYSKDSAPNIILPHGTEVEELTVVYVNCAKEYYKSTTIEIAMTCFQLGNWKPLYKSLCLKMCRPLNLTEGIDVSCTYQGKFVDCTNKSSIPSTTLTPKCKSSHYFLNGIQEPVVELHCHDNGTWIGGELYACQPKPPSSSNLSQTTEPTSTTSQNKCIIPYMYGHLYSEDPISTNLIPQGSEVEEFTEVYMNCAEGYYKSSFHDVTMRCLRFGIWKPMILNLCLKMCPPKKSDSLDISCAYYDKYADCTNKSSIPSTILIPKCKSTHYFPNGTLEPSVQLQCHDNGTWIGGELYTCVPKQPSSTTISNLLTIKTTSAIIKNKCVIPSIKGNSYYLPSKTNNKLPHGSKVEELTKIYVKCEQENMNKKYSLNFTMVCKSNGNWSTIYPNLCVENMCPVIKSYSLDVTCTYLGNNVDCTKHSSMPGTKLKQKCKSKYHLENEKVENDILCHKNGSWIGGKLYQCHPTCGKIVDQTKLWTNNGTQLKYAPWNVFIQHMDYDRKHYVDWCQGSLISTNLVISSIDCFLKHFSKYKVIVGLYSKNYKEIDLLRVHQSEYLFKNTNENNDIAVIVLKTRVRISDAVAPICINWYKKFTVQNGSSGKLVSSEIKDGYNILSQRDFQFIDRKNCQNETSLKSKYILYDDEFCSRPDSKFIKVFSNTGGGFTFEQHNSHFLIGIKKSYDMSSSILYFTNIHHHVKWINQLYLNYTTNAFEM